MKNPVRDFDASGSGGCRCENWICERRQSRRLEKDIPRFAVAMLRYPIGLYTVRQNQTNHSHAGLERPLESAADLRSADASPVVDRNLDHPQAGAQAENDHFGKEMRCLDREQGQDFVTSGLVNEPERAAAIGKGRPVEKPLDHLGHSLCQIRPVQVVSLRHVPF